MFGSEASPQVFTIHYYLLLKIRGVAQLGEEFAAACGRRRRTTQVKKHRVMRSAPSEQYDNVSEGSAADC